MDVHTAMKIIFYCLLILLPWAVFSISFIKDRRRYRNCYFLFFAIIGTFFALTVALEDAGKPFLSVILTVTAAALLIVPVFLIWNGVLMLRREGHSLSCMLSLLFGLAIGIGEAAAFAALILPEIAETGWNATGLLAHISRISMFICVSVVYFSMSFVVFMLYCVFLQLIPPKKDFDYVIIHGSGLLDGDRVPKLLSDRLDKAVEIYRRDPTPPVLIPSGGKGDDETVSEAEAMEKYLLGKGIPAEKIIREDRSTTTLENLKYSKAIIDERQGGRYIVLVTSNYHVYRALRYSRRIGLKCTGVGSHVAFYYWPSAIIREFIAVHSEKKHLTALIGGWMLCMFALVCIYFL
ncbi:MAG: YdcF family protein [Clostridia bacterium]|nr:YdcF family protein [Clostridia bacterium]